MKNNIIHRLLAALITVFIATIAGFSEALRPREECYNSLAPSPHPCACVPLTAEVALGVSFLLVKKGAAAGNFALCGVTDEPLGIATDTVAVGEKGNVTHFGGMSGTRTMIAGAAIAAQAKVYTAGSGKISSTGGTGKFLVGTAITAAAADGDEIEVAPCYPVVQP